MNRGDMTMIVGTPAQRRTWAAWGMCEFCGVKPEPGFKRCELHRALTNQRSRKCRMRKAEKRGR